MLQRIFEKNLPIQKIIVASSQAVYSEGAGTCPKHGLVFPPVRPVEQLQKGDWEVHCPICGAITKSADAIVRGAIADRLIAMILWKSIFVFLRGFITGWLLAKPS